MKTRPFPLRSRPRRVDERGAVAILVALSMTFLMVGVAMVLDFGLVRLERQVLKSVSDSAAMAGIAAGDGATGDVYSHRAVCGALAHLQQTAKFAPDGADAGLPDGPCAAASLAANVNVKCRPTDPSTHLAYDRTLVRDGVTYRVRLNAPYDPTSGDWREEDLSSVTIDQSSPLLGGCDQVGVQISERRDPGLGSLATSGQLSFGVRSAARALIGDEFDMAPALILLERHACDAVVTEGTARLKVRGLNQTPGSAHADSDGTGCLSGQQIFRGGQPDSIVAYGSTAPAGTSGALTAYAATTGVAANVIASETTKVYGTPSTDGTGTVKNPVTGRQRVGRRPVDERYRAAVRAAIATEDTSGVWNLTAATAAAAGWTVTPTCSVSDAQATATKLYINCAGGPITISKTLTGSEIFLNGHVVRGELRMPNATKVYVNNTTALGAAANDAGVYLEGQARFCVRSSCLSESTACPTTPTVGRAAVFVRQGSITANGGHLQMCNSTVFLLGGDRSTGCVPSGNDAAPTATPCAGGSSAGNGRISVSGGTIFDWSAPNQYAESVPLGSQSTAFSNFEDLAAWSESAGAYSFAGNGRMGTTGVFMIPNARPVSMGGTSDQFLTNAQYVARTFKAVGNATLNLTTDPRNAVTIPAIKGYVLVR